ncbi:MAG TPA: hypothetical protein VGD92_08965 [Sphingobacteriaceae bacterium]
MALLNFTVLGIWGVLLRYLQTHALHGLNYQFLLHGHSHFAFAGWMFLSLAVLMADCLGAGAGDSRFRGIFKLVQVCSLGMLVTFTLQGYQAVPILFSTLFVLITYWFSFLVLRNPAFKARLNLPARNLIGAALIFLCLSSLGPFALGPLMVKGLKDSPLYQNSIYFYLHFQMNGWMVLGALGLFASRYLERFSTDRQDLFWLRAFIWSSVPLYFIFTLWSGPDWLRTTLAATGAGLHLLAWIRICAACKRKVPELPVLVRAALAAITLKSVLQLLICLPPLGDWVFVNRNLIIGYIHLITLGSVSPLILDQFRIRGFLPAGKAGTVLNTLYLAGTGLYLGLLFIQPLLGRLGIRISHFHTCLLLISGLLVLLGLSYYALSSRRARKAPGPSAVR